MTRSYHGTYHIDPTYLASIVDEFVANSGQPETFAERCRKVAPRLAKTVYVRQLGDIPNDKPIVVAKNHPCHFDGLLLDTVFEKRPDIQLLAKPSPLTAPLPRENTLLLRKKGPHGYPDDIKKLQGHLRNGGSILATPWGALDHQARDNVSSERAAQNVVRYASFAGATVLPVHIEANWDSTDQAALPLEAATITIQEPIPYTMSGPNIEAITTAITSMYDRYTA